MPLLREAAKGVLRTLTAADFVTVVGFSDSARAYSPRLVQASSSTLNESSSILDAEAKTLAASTGGFGVGTSSPG